MGALAPPALEPASFGERLACWNGLDVGEGAAWEFLPGMRFGDLEAWWRVGAPRQSPHEGLDILWRRAADGSKSQLAPGARVPALWAGKVVAIVPDFLGCSLFVAHARADGEGRRLHSIFGHIQASADLVPGSAIGENDEVGRLAQPPSGRIAVPAHLHLTVAWVAPAGPESRLGWALLRDRSRAVLLDPLPVVAGA